jgi:lipoprotein-anchoring transpeptidase ErfK/SrfK
LGEKWIDINLSEQKLYAYEGNELVSWFWVSTGLPDTPTVTGTYSVYIKLLYDDMTGPLLPTGCPVCMYFYNGYGIHGTYWHSNFGYPMSHGCVNMETSEAGWLYNWAFVGSQLTYTIEYEKFETDS